MTGTRRPGVAASPGVAVGRALVLREAAASAAPPDVEAALAALAEAAAELGAAAVELRTAGLADEAEILETNRLMAEDPALTASVRELGARLGPAEAVRSAADGHAALLAALPDPLLAARAADVRELGRRAARIADGSPQRPVVDEATVLVARELGPAEVAQLDLGADRIVGVALAEGAPTSHAAIVARSLGVPMVVALGGALLDIGDGALLLLDGDAGSVDIEPAAEDLDDARQRLRAAARRRRALAGLRGIPVQTRDGRAVTLLCNACSVAEVEAGLGAGATGVGLLRTELAFLEASRWPSEDAHRRGLAPLLDLLRGRVATVRTLDFGADKTPPFLAGEGRRGLELMLAHPDALAAQLRAIVHAAAGTRLRLLLPLVETARQVRDVRALLRAELGEDAAVELGAMIETPSAVRRAREIALEADFLSIGTNDLVASTLGLDRELPLASAATTADPVVLAHIASVVEAAHEVGIVVEVCGEAAGVPELVPLLVGLGVDELSVAPARVDLVREVVLGLSAERAEALARKALRAPSAEAVLELVRSAEAGDELGEAVERLDRVRARG